MVLPNSAEKAKVSVAATAILSGVLNGPLLEACIFSGVNGVPNFLKGVGFEDVEVLIYMQGTECRAQLPHAGFFSSH